MLGTSNQNIFLFLNAKQANEREDISIMKNLFIVRWSTYLSKMFKFHSDQPPPRALMSCIVAMYLYPRMELSVIW